MIGKYVIPENLTVEQLKKEYTKEELKDIFMFEGEIVRLFLNNANSYFIESKTESSHKIYIPTEWITFEPELIIINPFEAFNILNAGLNVISEKFNGDKIEIKFDSWKDKFYFKELNSNDDNWRPLYHLDLNKFYKEVNYVDKNPI